MTPEERYDRFLRVAMLIADAVIDGAGKPIGGGVSRLARRRLWSTGYAAISVSGRRPITIAVERQLGAKAGLEIGRQEIRIAKLNAAGHEMLTSAYFAEDEIKANAGPQSGS